MCLINYAVVCARAVLCMCSIATTRPAKLALYAYIET